uniref:Tr-type G domain-containing protein n=1 Tax=Sinocyclocheilus grahami TaxID=75366 RepID=A0A672MDD9_SINGR
MPYRIAEVLVRKVPDDQQFLDLRVAVLGNVDSGKSTLLGVLTQGELDNGRGRARLNLFRHLHEIQTGRTSSISIEILGFDSRGEVRTAARCTLPCSWSAPTPASVSIY